MRFCHFILYDNKNFSKFISAGANLSIFPKAINMSISNEVSLLSKLEFAILLAEFENPYTEYLEVSRILRFENKQLDNFLNNHRTRKFILALAQDRKELSIPQISFWKDNLSLHFGQIPWLSIFQVQRPG